MCTEERVEVTAKEREVHLVRRCQAGDARAWDELVPFYLEHLVRYTASQVGSMDAEDLAQEALIDVWRRIRDYEPERVRLGSWMRLLARGRCFNSRRKADALHRPCSSLEEWMEPFVDGVAQVEAQVELKRLSEAMEALPSSQRTAFEATLWYDTMDEAATDMGCRRGTLSQRLTVARRRLRSTMQ